MKGKEYMRPVSVNMWVERRSYTLFMLRELTAVFVAGYSLFLLFLLYRASQGPGALASFTAGLRSPISTVLHLIALAMAVYHSITWFDAGAKAMPVWRGENRVSPSLIAASQYLAWIGASVVVGYLAFRIGRG